MATRPGCPECGGWDEEGGHEPECAEYVEPDSMPDAIERAEWRAEEDWRE